MKLRRVFRSLIEITFCVVAFVVIAWHIFGLPARRPGPIAKLNSPRKVIGLTSSTLLLENHMAISLPRVNMLPPGSRVFRHAIENGIEITTAGEVLGLLKI